MIVEIFKGAGTNPWYVRYAYDAGAVGMVSEGYLTKWNAKRAARKMFPHVEAVILDKPYKKFGP